MDLELNEQQSAILNSVRSVVNRFDDDYWLQLDRNGEFPHAFYQAMAEGGWLGVAMPEDVGGSDLGIFEAALIMITVADSPGAMAAASSIHINIFGPHPIVVFGNDEQKQAWLPELIQGKSKCCFGVTEPDSGLETGSIQTFAQATDNGYVVNGQKIMAGQRVMMLFASADRDGNEFPNPDQFELGRTPNRHLAFGMGRHRCLGSHLARMEIKVAVEELLKLLPDYQVVGDVEWTTMGPLPITFTPPQQS